MENEIAWRAVAAVKVPKAFPGMAVGKNPPNPVDKYAKNGIILFRHAGVAQLVEQLTCNQQVGGSSPLAGSTKKQTYTWWDGRVVKGSRL